MARIGYSMHLLQLAPPPAWSLAYLQAATRAVTPVPHLKGRPPAAGTPLTCRQVADLMVGAACASRPWHRMLRQREEGAERRERVPSSAPMGRPVQPPSLPALALGPVFSPLAANPPEVRSLSTARELPGPNNAHGSSDVQGTGADLGRAVPSGSEVPPGADLSGGLDSALIGGRDFSLSRCPASFDEADGDELDADGKAGTYYRDFDQLLGEDAAGSSSGSGLRTAGLAMAAQFAEAAEPLVLEHAGRMIPSDMARCLEAYWRLGRPASPQLLGVVQYRGGALLRVCNPNQSNAIIQVRVVGIATWACSAERHRAIGQYFPARGRAWCLP